MPKLGPIALLMMLAATAAPAHSKLNNSIPADGAVVSDQLEQITLNFNSGIRLTRLTLTVAEGDPIDLDLSQFKGFLTEFAVPVRDLVPASYTVTWRGLGTDGHPHSGSFQFSFGVD